MEQPLKLSYTNSLFTLPGRTCRQSEHKHTKLQSSLVGQEHVEVNGRQRIGRRRYAADAAALATDAQSLLLWSSCIQSFIVVERSSSAHVAWIQVAEDWQLHSHHDNAAVPAAHAAAAAATYCMFGILTTHGSKEVQLHKCCCCCSCSQAE
jgi:hypothetical protein